MSLASKNKKTRGKKNKFQKNKSIKFKKNKFNKSKMKKHSKKKMNGGGNLTKTQDPLVRAKNLERTRQIEIIEAEKKIWRTLEPEQKLLSNQKVRIQIQFEKKKIEGKANINVTYEDKKFILKIKLDRIPSVYDLKSSITYVPSSYHIYTEYNYRISDDGLRILKNGVDKFTEFDKTKFPNYYEKKNSTLPDLSQIILNSDKFIEIDKLKRILIKRILTENQEKDEEDTKNKVRDLHKKEGNLAQLFSFS